MSEMITAVYSNGVLHPQNPLSLSDGQTVRIQVLTQVGTGDRTQENPQSIKVGGGFHQRLCLRPLMVYLISLVGAMSASWLFAAALALLG